MKTKIKFTEQIRQAVLASDLTQYRICQLTGIDKAAMSRFIHGGGLSMESLDTLAECLGLSVRVEKPRKAKGR